MFWRNQKTLQVDGWSYLCHDLLAAASLLVMQHKYDLLNILLIAGTKSIASSVDARIKKISTEINQVTACMQALDSQGQDNHVLLLATALTVLLNNWKTLELHFVCLCTTMPQESPRSTWQGCRAGNASTCKSQVTPARPLDNMCAVLKAGSSSTRTLFTLYFGAHAFWQLLWLLSCRLLTKPHQEAGACFGGW